MPEISLPAAGWVYRVGNAASWSTMALPSQAVHNPAVAWATIASGADVVDQMAGFALSASISLTSGTAVGGIAVANASDTFEFLLDSRGGAASVHVRKNVSQAGTQNITAGNIGLALGSTYRMNLEIRGTEARVVVVADATGATLFDQTVTITIPGFAGVTRVGVSGHNGTTIQNLTARSFTVRASDQVTLAVLPAPTYVRMFYLLQSSTLSAPAKPATNPPQSPWSTVEPSYTEGSTDTLYTVLLTGYGPTAFEYGDVQKSSAFEAAKQAYNMAKAARDAAATAQTTADGKLTVADAAPVTANGTGKPLGALWMRRSGSNQIMGLWEWSGTAWVARALTNDVIANLDAGKINAGFLDVANRVQTASVYASKVVLGDTANAILDSDFRDANSWNLSGTTRQILAKTAGEVPAGAPSAVNVMRVASITGSDNDVTFVTGTPSNRIPVSPGDVYAFEFWAARSADCNSSFRFFLGATDQAGANPSWPSGQTLTPASVPAGQWVQVTGSIEIPAGKHLSSLQFGAPSTGAVTPAGAWYIAKPSYRRAAAGELIVDGAVTSRKVNTTEFFADQAVITEATAAVLRSHVVQVDHLSPYLADNLDLSSNGTINLIVKSQTEMTNELTQATSDIIDARAAAEAASAAAEKAQGEANGVAEAVALVEQKATDTDARLATVETWFWVDEEGAHVGKSDTSFQANVKPDRFEIAIGGQVQTFWSAGVMNVPTADIGTLLLDNHSIEAYGTGTVIRKLMAPPAEAPAS